MIIRMLLAASAALFAVNAFGANWVTLWDSEEERFSADADSVVRQNGTVLVWVQNEEKIPKNRLKIGGTTVGAMKSRWSIRCADRTISDGMSVFYDTSGRQFHSDKGRPYDFEDIVPDSRADALRTLVCR